MAIVSYGVDTMRTMFRILLPVFISSILLSWIPIVYTQDVLTITTSTPYVFNGAWQYDLVCKVSPLKAMTFRWEGIDCKQRETLVGGDRCKFTPSQFNNGTNVMCIASYGTNGSSSEISGITTLNVLYPPSTPPDITSNIIGDTMYVGQNYQLTCTIRGGSPLPTMYFGCAPTTSFHQGVTHWRDGYSYTVYDINPAVVSDNGGVCKCTGRWSPDPAVYPLSASVTLRAVDLNASAVPSIIRTTLAVRTSSSLSASEALIFTPRISSLTSSETPVTLKIDNEPDDQLKNVSIGIGIMGVLLLAGIIIGIFGLRMFLSKREKKPKQNGAAPIVGIDIIGSGQSDTEYASISYAATDRGYSPSQGTSSDGTSTSYLHAFASRPPSYLEVRSGSSTTGGTN